MPKTGFTLLELLIVIVIIGILAAIALPNFGPIKERALDKEAIVNLKLIQAAEKIYRMEYTFYYPYSGTANTSDLNNFLKLAIPAGDSRNWDYATVPSGQAQATRMPAGRTWTLSITTDNATCSDAGSCPPP